MAKKLPSNVTITHSGKYRVRYKKTERHPVDYDKTFDTLEEAKQAREEYLAKVSLKIYGKNTKKDIGFSDFCDYVLNWYRTKPKKPSQNTIRHYKNYMYRLKIVFKNMKLRDITPLFIEEILIQEKNRQNVGNGSKVGKAISDNTLHHEYTVLRMILNKAQKWGFIENNPINGVEEPTFEEKPIEVPEFEELENIEAKIMKAPIRDRIQFLLAFYGGIREEEVCGIHLEDINREEGYVSIKRAIVQNELTREYIEDRTKSQTSVRNVPMPSKFFDVLDEYLIYRDDQIRMLKYQTNGEYQEIPNLFLSKEGDFYRPYRLGRLWSKFSKENDIPLTYHGLRHYYITNQMNYNTELSERDVQELAGHSNIKTTYRYVHPSKSRIKANATNIFDKFNKDSLYKDGKNKLILPIEHIATIILGNPNYSKIEELQITLNELSKKEVNFFNISEVIENCKNELEANYPSLLRMEKYKYMKSDEEEIINSIKKEYGKEFQIELNNVEELEII